MISCHKKDPPQSTDQFDIFMIMGQSNTENGEGLVSGIDDVSSGIMQLGRHGDIDMKIVDAIEPLENWDPRPGRIGFGLVFAKLYRDSMLGEGRKVLLVPCGKGNTGFEDNSWNKGNVLYKDAITRVNWVLEHYKGSNLKAILWQQGERDVANKTYQPQLDNMIISFRADVHGDFEQYPFLAGGMVPYWVRQDSARQHLQDIIKTIPTRITKTAYVDPEFPFVISKPNDTLDDIHYNAAGQRELGRRYFRAYKLLVK